MKDDHERYEKSLAMMRNTVRELLALKGMVG